MKATKILFALGMAIGCTQLAQAQLICPSSIGIGTCTPAMKVHLVTATNNDGMRIEQTGTHGAVLSLSNTNSPIPPGSTFGRNWSLFSTGSSNGNLGGAGNFAIFDYNAFALRFIIRGTTGNVGIGTDNPLQKLHVNNGAMMVSGPNSSGGAMLLLSDNVNTHPNGRHGIEYVPNVGLNFWQPFNTGYGGGINWNLLIKDDGKVGIGIDPNVAGNFPAGYRLYVKTGILTEKVKVATLGTVNWSDYVFEADYDRNTLSEVEAFVQSEHHLPNVPSAAEVQANGVDMVEMDATLLRQIEELWLHMIDLKKENDALRAEIDQLR
jgi:hypothetical protein